MLAFWLMGVFLGYMLTFRAGLGVRGLWIGIMSGDFTAGAILTRFFVMDEDSFRALACL